MGSRHSRGKQEAEQSGVAAAAPAQASSQPSRPGNPGLPTIPKAPDGWRLPPRYEVVRNIGKGSYGSVSEVNDKDKGMLVAAKQMRGLFDDLIDCKRILRELAILAQLHNDSVVRIHDVVVPDAFGTFDELYIIMEICDSDMKKLIRQDVMLKQQHITTLLYNLLVGLKYIHSAGVYHRDLKPANCLVNQNCAVKICDFGLARAMGGEDHTAPVDAPIQEDRRIDRSLDNRAVTYLEMREAHREENLTEMQVEELWDALPAAEADAQAPVVPATLRRKRNMTQHVVTRWYRAPELILLQHGYTEAIDIWSIGCIFAELLQMQDESIDFRNRGPLFPGSSCFPLSPDRRSHGQKKRSANDQLEMIFSVIGTPTAEEVRRLENQDARRYVEGFPAKKGEGLSTRFLQTAKEALELLGQMLRFSPQDRCTVQKSLEHPLLAAVRDPSLETTAEKFVILDWEAPEMSEEQLRKTFEIEMNKFVAAAEA